jgi:YD repeat-containing protein
LLWSEDELTHFTTYTVDNLGRDLAIALPTGGAMTITIDAAGNRTSLMDPLPLPNAQTDKTQFQFDQMNRVNLVTDPNNLVTTYAYDDAGNIQDIYDRDVLPSGNHRHRHFIYDDAGRLITEQWKDGSTVNYSANYGYDAASELTSVSDNNSAYGFAYDSRGRLISADNANTLNIPHVVLTYQYDADGHRHEGDRSHRPAGDHPPVRPWEWSAPRFLVHSKW